MPGLAEPGHRAVLEWGGLLRFDHAAGDPVARGAGRLRLAVVFLGVEDHRLAGDLVRRVGQADLIDHAFPVGLAVRADLDVADVAGVAARRRRAGVVMFVGVEMVARGLERRRALAVLVDVEAVLAGGGAGEVHGHVDAVSLLAESHGAGGCVPLGRLQGGLGGDRFVGGGRGRGGRGSRRRRSRAGLRGWWRRGRLFLFAASGDDGREAESTDDREPFQTIHAASFVVSMKLQTLRTSIPLRGACRAPPVAAISTPGLPGRPRHRCRTSSFSGTIRPMSQENDHMLTMLKTAMRVLGYTNRDVERKLGLSSSYLSR